MNGRDKVQIQVWDSAKGFLLLYNTVFVLQKKKKKLRDLKWLLISGTIDFKARNITRDKYFTMIKGSSHQKDITIINRYIPKQRHEI